MNPIACRDKFFAVKILAVSVAVTVAAVFLPARYAKDLSSKRAALESRQSFEAVTAADIRRLDEVLTMSARLAAATGDERWERRYKAHMSELDAAIKTALSGASGLDHDAARRLDGANSALVGMEARAFELTRRSRGEQALRLLTGPGYQRQKDAYARSLGEIMTAVRVDAVAQREALYQAMLSARNLKLFSIAVMILIWALAFFLIYRNSLDGEREEKSLRSAREELESQVAQRTVELSRTNAALNDTISKREALTRYQWIQLDVALLLTQTPESQKPLLQVIEVICRGLGWSEGAVWEADDDAGVLRCAGFYQSEEDLEHVEFETATRTLTFKKGVGLPGRVWADEEPAWISDIQADANFPRASSAARAGLGSAFALPIMSGGRCLGVLEFFRAEKGGAEEGLLESMRILGVHLGQFLAKERSRRLQEETQSRLMQAQKMEAVGKLAGGVAHDFNNILSAILGYCELLIPSFAPEDPRLQDVGDLRDAANRAAGLTRQLLAFSRHQALRPVVTDVNDLVSNLTSMLGRLLREDVSLRTELKDGLGRVLIDPGQLEQVVVNLVVNASDAMPGGGAILLSTREATLDAEACARLRGLRPGPHVVLSVSDEGVGMSRELQQRIFEPFFTTKAPGKGTGLGLATVYGIIERSGGAVDVASAPGKGSSFMVYLPRTARVPRAAKAAPKRRPRGKESVLLVEDSGTLRRVVARMLARQGYRVLEAASGEEALALLAGGSGVDLLLSDVVMPGMSGRELARLAGRRHPAIKIIFMSGYADADAFPPDALDPGHIFMEKPFSDVLLAQKVREALDGPAPPPAISISARLRT